MWKSSPLCFSEAGKGRFLLLTSRGQSGVHTLTRSSDAQPVYVDTKTTRGNPYQPLIQMKGVWGDAPLTNNSLISEFTLGESPVVYSP